MDAGPGLNFFASNQERLLFATLGPLAVPETVRDEILNKSRLDQRFSAAEKVLGKLPERLFEVLPDAYEPSLNSVVERLTGMNMTARALQPKDLGEIMVIAHAVVAAEAGLPTRVLIDDGEGRRLATIEQRRLQRLRNQNPRIGQVDLLSTTTVLEIAARNGKISGREHMREVYEKLRKLDDGLVSLEQSELLKLSCWTKK